MSGRMHGRIRRPLLLPGALALGLAFLYLPIVSLVVFSFNASRLVTVWDAAHSPTLHWYVELFHNAQILQAARLSVLIATLNACGAVVLGTLAGFALTRLGRFRGRALLSALTTAPLVMPEIITGLSLLLLFIALQQLLGWPARRDATTIVLAHISFSVSYVAIIVQARLAGFDRSLEEAALDLGATPAHVFRRITLPLIAPALLSGWLLSFTLSWDDVVISQFVAGPGSSTLPMVIFSKVRLGVSPDVNALATLLITLVATGVIGSTLWRKHGDRRRARELQLAQGQLMTEGS
ncbi:MAG TPA: ABC transporter permease subunit [Steroidobacteraceae bacterium]|jgi:putrescine transport system permease protein|nr:ABC transporter permease subunit [Steroidobacteraceae bacterium]